MWDTVVEFEGNEIDLAVAQRSRPKRVNIPGNPQKAQLALFQAIVWNSDT
jgi:hypothetical protein